MNQLALPHLKKVSGRLGSLIASLACLLTAACEGEGELDNFDPEEENSPSETHETEFPVPLLHADKTLFDWNLPAGFPQPWEPKDNPTTVEKVELGRHLFYDKRLSKNEAQSCSSCHRQELAFTDGLEVGVGSTDESHSRSSMSLANVGYASSLTWGNPLIVALERQALAPLFGEVPVELGFIDQKQLEERLSQIPIYEELFVDAYPEADEHGSLDQIVGAIAAFQRTLISGRSAYDRWQHEEEDPKMSKAAIRGYELFQSEGFECFHCHGGFNFTDHIHYADKSFYEAPFHNTGLYNLGGSGDYPDPNWGVYSVSLNEEDMGHHKAPTLRNIAVTAPYMHDGSIPTLRDVLQHYAAGGRRINEGDNAGVGSENPYRDGLIRPIDMSEDEKDDLIAFLESLTDEKFLNNPEFADPWSEPEKNDSSE